MHRSLVEGVTIAVCFHFNRVASDGNRRPRYLRSDNGGIVGVTLPRESIVFVSNNWRVVLQDLLGAMRSYTLKMDQRLMEVTVSEARAWGARGGSATRVMSTCFTIGRVNDAPGAFFADGALVFFRAKAVRTCLFTHCWVCSCCVVASGFAL
jgi:hypothetical protein